MLSGGAKILAMQQAAIASVILAALLVVTLRGSPSTLLNKSDVLKDIQSEIALQSYWKTLDKHAKHVSEEVSAVQNARYENGLGTRYLSEQAQKYLGIDKYGRALANAEGQSLSSEGLEQELAMPSGHNRDVSAGQKRKILQRLNHGVLGASMLGLVRNLFGTRSTANHNARVRAYHSTAFGEPHFDQNGDPIPLRKEHQESLQDAGIKVSNELSEIDPSPRPDRGQTIVSQAAKGNFPVEGLYNNLLFGTPIKQRRARRQQKMLADELKQHKLDDEMLVGGRDGIFKDRTSALDKSPNSGLFEHLLFDASTKRDFDPKAAALHDNGMIVDSHNGFFSDSDSQPYDSHSSRPSVLARQPQPHFSQQPKGVQHQASIRQSHRIPSSRGGSPVKSAREVEQARAQPPRKEQEHVDLVKSRPEVMERPRIQLHASNAESSTQQKDDIANFFDSLKKLDALKHQEDLVRQRQREEQAKRPQVRPHERHDDASSRIAKEWKFAEKSLGVDAHKSKPQVVKQVVGQQPKMAAKLAAKSVEAPALKKSAVKSAAGEQQGSGLKSSGSVGGLLGETERQWMKEMESVPLSLFG
eukprot:749816-Hanusia_phi.AAC.1